MTNDMIRQIALANGFKARTQDDGTTDLNPYVYDFARALLADREAVIDDLESRQTVAYFGCHFCGQDTEAEITDASRLHEQNDALWETLLKIGDALDIDYDEARKADGKPSDVFLAHIKGMEATINRLEAQVEQLGEITGHD